MVETVSKVIKESYNVEKKKALQRLIQLRKGKYDHNTQYKTKWRGNKSDTSKAKRITNQ